MSHHSSEFPDPPNPLHRSFFLCSICHQAVPIDTCKTNERGQPVHEECYLGALSKPDGR
jgi:hypothetical protein